MPFDSVKALENLKLRFVDNKPKSFSLKSADQPLLLFTDGSYEPDLNENKAMIGGVLISYNSPCRVFGCHVPQELLDAWRGAGKNHLIGQVELYAVLIARYVWREQLHNRKVILFIDNWAVLDCYIPGTSKERTWRQLLLSIEETDYNFPCYAWATRVPSESNVADPPSRGTLEPLRFLGKMDIDKPKCPIVRRMLQRCLTEADEGMRMCNNS